MKKINVRKLHWELENAKIPIKGVNSKGEIWFLPEVTESDKKKAQQILDNHTYDWYYEKREKEYPPIKEQLDMIYKDMINGTNNWVKLITSIKNKYPKE